MGDDRYIKVLDIINILNKTHSQGLRGFYNCGELGVVYIWWGRHGWEWEWIEISDEFLLEK